MKTKFEWIRLFAVCLFLSSCRGKMETGRFLEDGKAIHGKMLNRDRSCLIGRPAEIVCIDSFLLFYDRYEGRTVTVFDAKNDRPVRRFLNEGQGPGEAVGPLKLSVSGPQTLNVFQMQNGHLHEYDIKDMTGTGQPSVFREYVFEDRPANIRKTGNRFIGIGMFENGRYRLYDEQGKTLTDAGKYPFRGEEMHFQARFFMYQGALCSSPDGTHFALGSSYCDNLEFYRVEKEGISPVRKYGTCDVEGHFDQQLALDDDCMMTYKGAYGTGRYCYMLYSGEKYGERHVRTTGGKKIVVFDWTGTHVNTFEADRTVFSFCVDGTDSVLYAVVGDEEEGFAIMSFELK